jgi:hypothetical protein
LRNSRILSEKIEKSVPDICGKSICFYRLILFKPILNEDSEVEDVDDAAVVKISPVTPVRFSTTLFFPIVNKKSIVREIDCFIHIHIFYRPKPEFGKYLQIPDTNNTIMVKISFSTPIG